MDLALVDKARAKISEDNLLDLQESEKLKEKVIYTVTYNSNAIAGNSITLDETVKILDYDVVIEGKPLGDHFDIVGHNDAFNFLCVLSQSMQKLNDEIIRSIHSLVYMRDVSERGRYRCIPIAVTKDRINLGVDVEHQINLLLESYESKKKSSHIIEAACFLLLEYERIHPFIDANGRTARLLLNFELIKAGYMPIDIKVSERDRYYSCYDSYFKSSNIQPFVDFVAEHEINELENYLALKNTSK